MNRSVALFALLAVSCRPQQSNTPRPVCEASVAARDSSDDAPKALPADIWFNILLRGFDRDTKRLDRPATACDGTVIATPTNTEICDLSLEGSPLPPRPLEERDLFLAQLDSEHSFVWVQTTELDSGEVLGPAGLFGWTERGLAIQKLGVLRAYPRRQKVWLRRLGDSEILQVESQQCDHNLTNCRRVTDFLRVDERSFASLPLFTDHGECRAASTRVNLEETLDLALSEDRVRRFKATRSIESLDAQLIVTEQIEVYDHARGSERPEPDTMRSLRINRPVSLVENGFSIGAGLWEKTVADFSPSN